MNDKELKKLFDTGTVEFSDEKFTERVIRHLPPRRNLLPQLVVVFASVVGTGIVLTVMGIAPLLDRIEGLVAAVGRKQMPSASSIATVLGMLAIWGLVGWSVSEAGKE